MRRPVPRVAVSFMERDEHDRVGTLLKRVDPSLCVGDEVVAYEPGDIRARARVAAIDHARGIIDFDVDWDSIELEEDLPTEPSSRRA